MRFRRTRVGLSPNRKLLSAKHGKTRLDENLGYTRGLAGTGVPSGFGRGFRKKLLHFWFKLFRDISASRLFSGGVRGARNFLAANSFAINKTGGGPGGLSLLGYGPVTFLDLSTRIRMIVRSSCVMIRRCKCDYFAARAGEIQVVLSIQCDCWDESEVIRRNRESREADSSLTPQLKDVWGPVP